MKKIKSFLFSTFFLLSLSVGSVMAECTPEQVIQMYEKGLSEELIKSVCGSVQKEKMGQRCVTEYGVCSLSAPEAVGTPCSCINKYTGRSDQGTVQK